MVFPAIDLILAVLFFVKVGTAYMDYRKHGQIEWAPPVILFACLVFMLTAPLYIWVFFLINFSSFFSDDLFFYSIRSSGPDVLISRKSATSKTSGSP
mgnify:CR=1 FL=1